MRSTRALIAGTALAASLTLGAPAAAFAADVSDPGGHGGYSSGQESADDYGSGGSWKEKESKGKEEQKEEGDWTGKGKEEQKEEGDWSGKGGYEDKGDYGSSKGDYNKGDYGSKEKEESWGGKGKEEGGWGGSSSYGKEREHEKPHGGVHTGGGGMATTGGGMAAGSVLLLGGLGAGAYALRRRKPSGTAI